MDFYAKFSEGLTAYLAGGFARWGGWYGLLDPCLRQEPGLAKNAPFVSTPNQKGLGS